MSSGKTLTILRTPTQYQTEHAVWYDLCIMGYK